MKVIIPLGTVALSVVASYLFLFWLKHQEPIAQATIQPDIAANSLTHTVWRSANGRIEDECESVGFPTPQGRGVIVLCIYHLQQMPLYVEASVTVYPFSKVDINRSTGAVSIGAIRPTITVGE